mgnify:CR=1 FL=1
MSQPSSRDPHPSVSAASIAGSQTATFSSAPSPQLSGSFLLTAREHTRFERAIAGIDAINSGDPNWIWVRDRERPRELALAELVSGWVLALRPHASLELRLAARAHHIRRWAIPRSSFPAGTAGYLRWRTRLQHFHAEEIGILLAGEGYPEDTILRVQALIRKLGLGHDPEVQALEDAICLTFFETQLGDLVRRTPPPKMAEIVRRTLAKMSARAVEIARSLPLGEPSLLLRDASEPSSD